MKNIAIIFSILFVATSCGSNVKSTWSCPTLGEGKGNCSFIKDADFGAPTENKLSNAEFVNSKQKIEIMLIAPKFKDLKKLKQEDHSVGQSSCSIVRESKLRTQEKIGKIWFAPHIDSEGYQHSEKTIHVVDEESVWMAQ
jgi:type IV conjugative transfer system lipoprotein TraV